MTDLFETRAQPGDLWWEYELMRALWSSDVDRLVQLLDLADAQTRRVAA